MHKPHKMVRCDAMRSGVVHCVRTMLPSAAAASFSAEICPINTKLTIPCENCNRYDNITGHASVNNVLKFDMNTRQYSGLIAAIGV